MHLTTAALVSFALFAAEPTAGQRAVVDSAANSDSTPTREPIAAMMSWQEYAAGQFPKPYVARFKTAGGGELVYFGAEHSNDPAHPQFIEIERLWNELRPQAAFCEGRLPGAATERDAAIRSSGEPGFLRHLATRDGATAQSMDSDIAAQAAYLLARHPADKVKLYFALRQVVRHKRFEDARPLEPMLLDYLGTLAKIDGLAGAPVNLDELAATFDRHFADLGSYRDAEQTWFNPLGQVCEVNAMTRDLADERNRDMFATLVDQVSQGKRVFAVVGRTHAIMQEPALRAALEPR